MLLHVSSWLLPLCDALIFIAGLFFTETNFVAYPSTRYVLLSLKPAFHLFYFSEGKTSIEQVRWVYV